MSAISNITCVKNSFIDNQLTKDKYRAIFALLIAGAMLLTCTTWFMEPGRNSCSVNVSSLKSRGHIINVQAISQYPELPSGCEPTAAAMLLKWAGVNVTKEDVAKVIPKSALPAIKNGVMRGSSPDNVFIGDPFSSKGFGAYHEVIANLINKYLPDQADDVSGTSFENILSIIDSGRPVIVWSTMGLSKPGSIIIWYDESNKKVDWKSPEHVYLVVGYEGNDIYADDPNTGRRQSYSLSLFKKRWEQMGSQAVTISESKQLNFDTAPSLNNNSSEPNPDALLNMDFARQKLNVEDMLKRNIDKIVAEFANAMYSCYINIKNVHIMLKLYSAAESLYKGIIYIADNM